MLSNLIIKSHYKDLDKGKRLQKLMNNKGVKIGDDAVLPNT